MFDIAPTELLLCAVVALVVIGPKDLPKAMRTVGQFVAKVRGIGRQFRSGFDEMVREAELKEMEETWAKENARIMREHPPEEIHDAEYAHGTDVALPAPVTNAVIEGHPATAVAPNHDADVGHFATPGHPAAAGHSAGEVTPAHDMPSVGQPTPVHDVQSHNDIKHEQAAVVPSGGAMPDQGHDAEQKRMEQK